MMSTCMKCGRPIVYHKAGIHRFPACAGCGRRPASCTCREMKGAERAELELPFEGVLRFIKEAQALGATVTMSASFTVPLPTSP